MLFQECVKVTLNERKLSEFLPVEERFQLHTCWTASNADWNRRLSRFICSSYHASMSVESKIFPYVPDLYSAWKLMCAEWRLRLLQYTHRTSSVSPSHPSMWCLPARFMCLLCTHKLPINWFYKAPNVNQLIHHTHIKAMEHISDTIAFCCANVNRMWNRVSSYKSRDSMASGLYSAVCRFCKIFFKSSPAIRFLPLSV
jgi:hypothetical protein